jgi:TRAP-type C4-dicarboxylate transport system permease small subunit
VATLKWLTALNARLSRWALYIAVAALLAIVAVVVWGVVERYIFNNAQPYVEQVALILVITVAMFGASAGVRDEGHIGMESLVGLLPETMQFVVGLIVGALTITFGALLFGGCLMMAASVYPNTIPTLGISEAVRYAPPIVAGVLIILFAVEHLIALFTHAEVVKSWY